MAQVTAGLPFPAPHAFAARTLPAALHAQPSPREAGRAGAAAGGAGSGAGAAREEACGVGITFGRDAAGMCVVKALAPDGPAARVRGWLGRMDRALH